MSCLIPPLLLLKLAVCFGMRAFTGFYRFLLLAQEMDGMCVRVCVFVNIYPQLAPLPPPKTWIGTWHVECIMVGHF